ncbi:MAG TPA: LAGLIDADG family homing endonuclease, partial [Trueperaceae bacterium]
MFRRVAEWVASPESAEARPGAERQFYDLMASKRFCPGGRVLAGAATSHGNVLNCFVQDGSPHPAGSNAWVLRLATKLALVTKVGGGNGLCLDPLPAKRPYHRTSGRLYLTIASTHPDYDKVKSGTYMDLVLGKYVERGYRNAVFAEADHLPAGLDAWQVGDSVESIWQHAGDLAMQLLRGEDVLLDLSGLRPEGTPVKGSGGSSSGPSSFAVEVFDNFATWATLGGADFAGPVATLRYIFAPTLRVIRQGGCLHPDTLVHTSRGTLRLRELVDPYQYGWQEHRLHVATDEGWRESPRGYNNAIAETLKVKLASGQEVQGTPNHKLKVMRETGERVWVPLSELRPGDWIIQILDQHTGAPVTLAPLADTHPNADDIHLPEFLTEQLAFFLGYLWGDGFIRGNRIGLAVCQDSPMMERAPRLFEELFGLEARLVQNPNDKRAVFSVDSATLVSWLNRNGLRKSKARELELPRAVRQAPRPVVGAFLQGLFEADGTITAGYPALSSASKQLMRDVMVMLGGLGIPTKLLHYEPLPGRFSKHEHYRLRVTTARGLARYLERVGVLKGSRLEALDARQPDTRQESSWPLPHAKALLQEAFDTLPVGAKGRPSQYTPVRKTLSRYLRGERQLTATSYELLRGDALVGDKFANFDFNEYYVRVEGVEVGGRILTLDLSVDENHTYLANGLVSHNTRRGAGMATMSITHPDIHDFITAKDLRREKDEGDISTFNISVLVTDEFMRQSQAEPMQGVLYDIAEHAHQTGEPGVIFIDR